MCSRKVWLHNINYESLSDHDCIMVIVSTHGSKGGVLLAKDKEFYTKDVWGPFRDCDKLKHIPKVFIFQACRGKKIERRISQEKYMSLEEEICAVPVLPHQKEFLLVHSTIPDYCSKRDFQNGTIFIQAFCNQLEAFFKREGKVELVPLLTEVNNQVTVSSEERGESQTSTFTSFLHQPLFLKNEVEKEKQHVSKK
ncbi:hypothetical protein B566_EDAN013979 [Ephemera danica]|nr:hypothetical protein B566_EDAN013979 [Ephemera danica]